jgi:hypothetical protein
MGSREKMVMFLSKYSLDKNNSIASLFRTQYTPDFLKADYYALRNTIFWVTKDLASALSHKAYFTVLYCNLKCYNAFSAISGASSVKIWHPPRTDKEKGSEEGEEEGMSRGAESQYS